MQQVPADVQQPGGFREAARFWEPRRLWYNALLALVVLLWFRFTWPHFRPALNLVALGKMIVLAIVANVCYCAAYGAEFFVQGLLRQSLWRRCRWTIWVFGMLLALLMENYWIADEIYPDVQQGASGLVGAASSTGGTAIASNTNFPAPLAVLGFLAACGGIVLCLTAVLVFWFARKPKLARIAGLTVAAGTVVYFALLLGFSAESHDVALAPGQEKYFCEIDCHLAYSVANATTKTTTDSTEYYVALRTRFDETTTSADRPKDALLLPSPRQVRLIDAKRARICPRFDRRTFIDDTSQAGGFVQDRTRVPGSKGYAWAATVAEYNSGMARSSRHWRREQLVAWKNLFRTGAG